jgi:hypothetical protein
MMNKVINMKALQLGISICVASAILPLLIEFAASASAVVANVA